MKFLLILPLLPLGMCGHERAFTDCGQPPAILMEPFPKLAKTGENWPDQVKTIELDKIQYKNMSDRHEDLVAFYRKYCTK